MVTQIQNKLINKTIKKIDGLFLNRFRSWPQAAQFSSFLAQGESTHKVDNDSVNTVHK